VHQAAINRLISMQRQVEQMQAYLRAAAERARHQHHEPIPADHAEWEWPRYQAPFAAERETA
jgi:hypothetical protein